MAWTEIKEPEEGQECEELVMCLCNKMDCIIKHLEIITEHLKASKVTEETETITGYHERCCNG